MSQLLQWIRRNDLGQLGVALVSVYVLEGLKAQITGI